MGRRKQDLRSLPAWAQNRILALESNVEWWKKKARGPTKEEACIFVDHDWTTRTAIGDKDTRIVFVMRHGKKDSYEIRLGIDRNELQITLHSFEGYLAVMPKVSNAITVKRIKRKR